MIINGLPSNVSSFIQPLRTSSNERQGAFPVALGFEEDGVGVIDAIQRTRLHHLPPRDETKERVGADDGVCQGAENGVCQGCEAAWGAPTVNYPCLK